MNKPRVLMVAAARQARDLTEHLRHFHPEIDVALYFSRKKLFDYCFPKRHQHADYIAPSIATMRPRRGRRGHLIRQHRYSGLLAKCLAKSQYQSFYQFLFHFADQMARGSSDWRSNGHRLSSLHEHMDYLHLVSDMIADTFKTHQIDVVVFTNVPHLAWDLITFKVAELLGIRTIILSQSLFPAHFFSMESPVYLGQVNNENCLGMASPYRINRNIQQEYFYMKNIVQGKAQLGSLTVSNLMDAMIYIVSQEPKLLLQPKQFKKFIKQLAFIRKRFPEWRDPFSRCFLRRNIDYFLDIVRFERQTIDLDKQYVYFALHLQPEASTSALGGIYVDQALAIEHLSMILPKSCKIYVKENPKQQSFMRNSLFFQRLMRVQNVVIVPSYTSTHDLLARSIFTATISGTVGWESICRGKNVVIFGAAWYKSFPGVFPFSIDLSFRSIVEYAIDHDALEQSVGQFLAMLPKGTIDLDYAKEIEDFNAEHNTRDLASYLVDLILKRKDCFFAASRH